MFIEHFSLKKIFLKEIRDEINKFPFSNDEIITEERMAPLPEPVKKYFRYCGFIGRKMMNSAEIVWKDASLRLSDDKKWRAVECIQFNSVKEPCRIVYMKSHLGGIIPFEGRDKCQSGAGNMLIKILKLFKVADAGGKEMDKSALVTVLAETMLVPGYAFQKYITWTSVDQRTAKAALNFNGYEVSGTFHFNELGELYEFVTDDRYQSANGKDYKRIRWSAICGSYVEKQGFKFPSELKAVWREEEGDYHYFNGIIENIIYDRTGQFCAGRDYRN